MKLGFGILFFSVLLANITAHSQNTGYPCGKTKIGSSFSSFGTNELVSFKPLEGAAEYTSDHFYSLGILHLYTLNHKWSVETGIEYSNHKITVEPNVPPGEDDDPYGVRFSLINIPITFRLNFNNYFFINGGVLFDLNTRSSKDVDAQTGLGGILGIGHEHELAYGFSIFFNPYFKMHSVLNFSSEKHPHRLLETGLRFGILYKL